MYHWIRLRTTMRPSFQSTSIARVYPPFRSLSTTYPVIRSAFRSPFAMHHTIFVYHISNHRLLPLPSLSVFVYYVSSHTICGPISVRHALHDLRIPHIQSAFTSVAQSVFGLPISVCHVCSHTICFTRSKRISHDTHEPHHVS